MHFYVVQTVFVEKAEMSCHRTTLEILNLRLSASTMPLYWHLVLCLRGFFIMPDYDSCEKQHKVGIKLMCPFVEKLLKFKKVCGSGPKSAQKNCPVMPMYKRLRFVSRNWRMEN